MTRNLTHKINKNLKKQILNSCSARGIHDPVICSDIIDILFSTENHLSVAQLSAKLKEMKHNCDSSNIEKILQTLCDYGLISQLKLDGGAIELYEHIHPETHHDHFICTKCGKIVEFNDPKLEELQDSLTFAKGFMPIFHKLEIYGLCDECNIGDNKTYPLRYAREKTSIKVRRIESGLSAKKRLTELGFIEKEPVHVIKNSGFGPMVVEVKGTRIALGHFETLKIIVSE